MSEETKVQAVCECGHAMKEHGSVGCYHVIEKKNLSDVNYSLCGCQVTWRQMADKTEAEVLQLRQQLAEAQAEKVKAQHFAFLDGAKYWFESESSQFKGEDYENLVQVAVERYKMQPQPVPTRYPDAAKAQVAGEVKRPNRPMPTREQVEEIVKTGILGDLKTPIADAIMALFTNSAGGEQ